MASLSHATMSYSEVPPRGRSGRRTQAAANFIPALGENGVDGALGGGVARDLLGVEDGFKLADEIGGADDFFAQRAQELNGSGVDHGDVHDVVIGRVLHGDFFLVLEEILEARVQFLPTGVERLWSRAARRGGPARCGARACAARPMAGMK